MIGHYLGGSYFGRFFGNASSVVIPATLDEAIRVHLLANVQGLTDCYLCSTPDKVATTGRPPLPPYLIVNPLSETPDGWNLGGKAYPAWAQYQITVNASTDTQARTLRDAAYKLFTPRKNSDGSHANATLVFSDGLMPNNGVYPGQKIQIIQPGKGPNGTTVNLWGFSVRFYVTRWM
jgi:hypothetical protein